MIVIEQNNLQEGVEYFIERSDDSDKKRKLRGTFVKNTTTTPSCTILTSHFIDAKELNPNKIFFSDKMSFTQPYIHSYYWRFYQISEPIIYQKSIDRLYENAINITLRNITGDKWFIFTS